MSTQSLKVLKLKKRDFRDLCGVNNKLRAQELRPKFFFQKFCVSTPLLKLLVAVFTFKNLDSFWTCYRSQSKSSRETLIMIRDSPADLTPNPQDFVICGTFFCLRNVLRAYDEIVCCTENHLLSYAHLEAEPFIYICSQV